MHSTIHNKSKKVLLILTFFSLGVVSAAIARSYFGELNEMKIGKEDHHEIER